MGLRVTMELLFLLITDRRCKEIKETHFQNIFKNHYSDYSNLDNLSCEIHFVLKSSTEQHYCIEFTGQTEFTGKILSAGWSTRKDKPSNSNVCQGK